MFCASELAGIEPIPHAPERAEYGRLNHSAKEDNGLSNVSCKSQLVYDTTLVSSLSVSSLTTVSNNTTLLSSFNVSGCTN